MSNLINKNGFAYTFDVSACSTCQGRCCTGESGYIFVSKEEIKNLANLLNLEIGDFVNKYLYKKGYKYSIKEMLIDNSYECIFYDRASNGCKVYDARPSQCRTFPFWDYYKTRIDELKLECPGIIQENADV
jgi:Fe-S-cluster containining protein